MSSKTTVERVREAAEQTVSWMAEQKYQGELILHAVVCCDFASRQNFVNSISERILRAVEPVVEENKRFKRAMVPPTGAIDYPTMVSQLTADSAKWQAECERYKGLRGCEDCGGLFPIGALNTPTVDPNGPALCKSCIGDDLRRDRDEWQARAEAGATTLNAIRGAVGMPDGKAHYLSWGAIVIIRELLDGHAREAEPTTEGGEVHPGRDGTCKVPPTPEPPACRYGCEDLTKREDWDSSMPACGCEGFCLDCHPSTPEPPAVRIGHRSDCPHFPHLSLLGKTCTCDHAAVVAALDKGKR